MKNSEWIGKDVIVRNSPAGVLFGRVRAKTRTSITLELGGKLHYWTGALCVEAIAEHGVASAKKASFSLQQIRSVDGEQLVLATDEAMRKLRALPDWKG